MGELVSVIIPFYNCSYVHQAIESALAQTYSPVEVIVVNDGSIKEVERVTPYLPYIHYIEKENGGTASALNAGIRAASGSYFCWLSSDDVFLPGKVDTQLTEMKRIGANFSFTAFDTMDATGQTIDANVELVERTVLDLYRRMSKGCPINGCTVLCEMDLFYRMGVFDESFRFTQDYELWLRFLPSIRVHYVRQPLTRYRVHTEMGTKQFPTAIRKEIRQVRERYSEQMGELIREERLKNSQL